MSEPATIPLVDAQHPWLGLLPFKEVHRRFFFGRDAEIEHQFFVGSPAELGSECGGADVLVFRAELAVVLLVDAARQRERPLRIGPVKASGNRVGRDIRDEFCIQRGWRARAPLVGACEAYVRGWNGRGRRDVE